MLARMFTIVADHDDPDYPIAVIDSARSIYVYSALGIPRWGADFEFSLGRFSGRKVIPAGKRVRRRYAGKVLPALIVAIGNMTICGDYIQVAGNGLTQTRLLLLNPGWVIDVQIGCVLEHIRYNGLGFE